LNGGIGAPIVPPAATAPVAIRRSSPCLALPGTAIRPICGGAAGDAAVPVVWSEPDWLAALGLDVALMNAGRGYTRAMSLTLIPMLGVALFRTILTAAEKPKVFLRSRSPCRR